MIFCTSCSAECFLILINPYIMWSVKWQATMENVNHNFKMSSSACLFWDSAKSGSNYTACSSGVLVFPLFLRPTCGLISYFIVISVISIKNTNVLLHHMISFSCKACGTDGPSGWQPRQHLAWHGTGQNTHTHQGHPLTLLQVSLQTNTHTHSQ